MTHSHDTSTPAMSAETVPSEEFVLVPKGQWTDAYKAFVGAFDTAIDRRKRPDEYALDARIRLREFNDAVRAAATAPNPSPALAKVGDAVREALVEPLKWARTTDPSEGSVHYGTGVFGHWYAASRVKPKVWSVNHHIDGKNVIVGLFESLQSAYAAAQSDYDCRIRAALSTPTEGPASAEDWLRGMARMSSYPVEICQKFEDLADLIMERHNATA